MEQEEIVLCGSSAYTKKFYLNPLFNGLPEGIKEDLNILCVLYTELNNKKILLWNYL